tara:strand:- start:1674 stop:2237 length:564 start_codon:yes stop_codon:yes gene_type:complete
MTLEPMLLKVFLSTKQTITQVVSRIVPPKEVEDIVQETYVRICQIDQSKKIDCPKSYMLRTAKNLAYDHLKRSETKLVDELDTDAFQESFEFEDQDPSYTNVINNKAFADFCEAVRLLPPQCRKVFVLKKVYGYTQKEIATQCNISESTVEKHIILGLKKCTLFMREREHFVSSDSSTQNRHGATHE